MSSWAPEEKILDMDEGILHYCKDFIVKAFNEEKTEKAIAEFIRTKLEEKDEGKWNVILGKNFASHVVHRSRRYGFFQVGEIQILIWQSGSPNI
jgi:dynein light chain LC8-type